MASEPRAQLLWFAGAALAAAALTLAVGPQSVPVLLAVAVALAPWAVLLRGISLPTPLFAIWALLPEVYLVAGTGNVACMFLVTVAVSRVASRTSSLRVVLPVTLIGALLIFLHPGYFLEPDSGAGLHDALLDGGAYFAFGVVFGALVGAQLRRETELTGQLRQAQAQLSGAAAAAERRRIARDVHDIVGHSLTVVVLHLAGARRLIGTDPEAAGSALLAAEQVGRQSLDAIRGVVGLLREDGPGDRPAGDDLDPDPGYGLIAGYDVAGVVDAFRQAGGRVELTIHGEPSTLPAPARATLYRFVQEALTNVGRHGVPGAVATLSVRISRTAVQAEARNPAPRRPESGSAGEGHGLQGMRERVAALGGRLGAGQVDEEWVVSCDLPLNLPLGSALPGTT